jgi:hypothetical protein
MEKYLEWVDRSEPYAENYGVPASEYQPLLESVEAIGLPISREIFGTE